VVTAPHPNKLLALRVRENFVGHAVKVLPPLAGAINDKLCAFQDQARNALEMQKNDDARRAFKAGGPTWVNQTAQAWNRAFLAVSDPAGNVPAFNRGDSGKLELIGDGAMEEKILSSRLALRLLDYASWELNDLRLRVQSLEQSTELPKSDVLRPEVIAEKMVKHWIAAGLSRDTWTSVQDLIHSGMSEHFLEAYHAANAFLVQNNVMAEIDLRPLVRRTPSAGGNQGDDTQRSSMARNGASTGFGSGTRGGGGSGGGVSSADVSLPGLSQGRSQRFVPGSTDDETRMQTSTTPLARARSRAQGLMGQLKRLLTAQVQGFDETRPAAASPQLAQAMAGFEGTPENPGRPSVLSGRLHERYETEQVEQAAGVLRQQTSALKQAATTAEKATIEIVALMFQSILAEERIPPTVRVWFARLQMPVLRVAISEPEFFGSNDHPARLLIDRMGSCVLGFDAKVSGNAVESEIKRVVQVIEQYPETGRRAFQLMHDEFQKFLSKFLSEQESTARVVGLAQQVEQKETMAIQYTIEMRNMLHDMPVREEIRDFLFKVWSEVLALTAVRNGPQHAETLALKRAASDLVWAAGAKPSRADRAKVISDMPRLLQLLRQGMSMLALPAQVQSGHIKTISDTLADAFMSKTDAISVERIEVMTRRLANLEDYLSDEDVGDLPLDTDSLVMILGIDASDIEVITDGGSQPTQGMRAWAEELQLGAWFTMDHNGRVSQVQFVWRSERKQLHLFASVDGRNLLIQARRLAAYLQAGLLVPTEEETLTVRATRNALAKLDANPERLLS
jgi:Protein of unknown function (DUF1631)